VYVRKVVFEEADSLQWLMRDITERKDLDTLREQLTSMIYHDLRSPLANIVSSLDVLATLSTGPENETIRSVTNITRRSTDRIQRLINSLLDINRLGAGQIIVSQQAVKLTTLAEDAMGAVRPMTDSRRQTLINRLPDKLPLVWVDLDMTRRVFINLMENASKFTPSEGTIELGGMREGEWVQLWVQDNGPGIPFDEQERIFDIYAQLRSQKNIGGLGIGLAFCRLAVLGHGGKIWVESEVGKGSKFILTLPVAKGK
jgi:two-component system, NtrC family, sensor histidine kinase KinB